MTYRAEGEVEGLRETIDSLKTFQTRVTETGLLEASQLDDIDREVAASIGQAVTAAMSGSPPSAEDLLTDVYVSY